MWGKFKKLLHRLKNLKLKKLLSDLGTAWENFLDNFLNLCGRVIFVSTVILSMFAIYIHLSNDLVGITRHFPQLPSYLKVDFFIDNYNKSLFVHSVICLFSVISIFFLRNTSLFYNKEFFRVFMFIATFGPVLSSSLVFSKLYCNTMVIYDKVDIVPYVAFVFFLYGIMLLLLSVIYYWLRVIFYINNDELGLIIRNMFITISLFFLISILDLSIQVVKVTSPYPHTRLLFIMSIGHAIKICPQLCISGSLSPIDIFTLNTYVWPACTFSYSYFEKIDDGAHPFVFIESMLRLLVNYNGYFWIKTLFIPSLVIVLITFLTYLLIDFIINNDDSGSEDVNGKGEDNEKNQK